MQWLRTAAVLFGASALLLVGCRDQHPLTEPTPVQHSQALPSLGPLSRHAPEFLGPSEQLPPAGPISREGPLPLASGDAGIRTGPIGPSFGLVWQNVDNGFRAVAHMQGSNYTGHNLLPLRPVEWDIAGAADFTGDEHPDLVWQNLSTGAREIWHMEGTTWTGVTTQLGNWSPVWRIAAAADFTRNGTPDLVWQNLSTGARAIMHMQGTAPTGQYTLLPERPVEWDIAGAADFTGNGTPDLVWQNLSTGDRKIWHMEGTTPTGQITQLPNVPAVWEIAAVGDFNDDRKADLVWQNLQTGHRAIWFMNGTTPSGQYAVLPQVSVEWRIAAVLGGLGAVMVEPQPTRIGIDVQHGCALRADDSAVCWGDNQLGALGTGSLVPEISTEPVVVTGGLRFRSIGVGSLFTCALTQTGGDAYCWGNGGSGQLGDGTSRSRPSPGPVTGGPFVDLSVGENHVCGITSAGQALCWGQNSDGQLGIGSTAWRNVPTPVAVEVGLRFAAISAGNNHTCALTPVGETYCWGRNSHGQLGDGSTSQNPVTRPVRGAIGTRFRFLSAGIAHTCGVSAAGEAFCWGSNSNGELGDGTTTHRLKPAAVQGGLRFASISAGSVTTCGITMGNLPYCWGWNFRGQVGDGTLTDRSTPTLVGGGTTLMTAVATGGQGSCGISTTGQAFCWGSELWGRLGNSRLGFAPEPVPVVGVSTLRFVSAGREHSCGVAGGAAFCWGNNANGQLGDGSLTTRTTAVRVVGPIVFDTVAVGASHSCGLSAGQAYCWGSNDVGQLGNGSNARSTTPVAVSGPYNFRSLHLGGSTTCGITVAEPTQTLCWGANSNGQFGNGFTGSSNVPVPAATGVTLASMTVGWNYACGVRADAVAFCWGNNSDGQLGDGTTTQRLTPTPVAGPHNTFASMDASITHTCGVTPEPSSQAFCWGVNGLGQLGDGTTTQRLIPAAVLGPHTFASLTLGTNHTCGRTAAGQAWCWGSNFYGVFGNGSFRTRSLTPVPAAGGLVLAQVSSGELHICGTLPAGGGVRCWGWQDHGRVGDGMLGFSPLPSLVQGGHVYRTGGS